MKIDMMMRSINQLSSPPCSPSAPRAVNYPPADDFMYPTNLSHEAHSDCVREGAPEFDGARTAGEERDAAAQG